MSRLEQASSTGIRHEKPAAGTGSRQPTVRDVAIDVLRFHALTTIFANPGSTEIPFLVDLPRDFRFVLALHEASVVGIATGWALANREPAFVSLHTTAGFGNAVGAIATARVNRAPMVILVGQQDRRHLALEPFVMGQLDGLAGAYPVWMNQPVRAQDVPGALARARHEAVSSQGPAVVIVPMDDWDAAAPLQSSIAAPKVIRRAAALDPEAITELADLVAGATFPALVVGAGADDAEAWEALVALAEQLSCPVWQESFGARAGFPQDHPLFAGHLPARPDRLRTVLSQHDLVVVVGAPAFRQRDFQPGGLVHHGTRLALITDDVAEANRSPVEIAVLGSPAAACTELALRVPRRTGSPASSRAREAAPLPPPSVGQPMRSDHVLAAVAERLPRNAVVVEEVPSSRDALEELIPAVQPGGQLHAAMGGLGFALSSSIGLRMANTGRPVVAIVGDGSALYTIQSLWSAAHYRVPVLFIVLANGRYAVMDKLAALHSDGRVPWPRFEEVSVSGLAQALGCPAEQIDRYDRLVELLDASLRRLSDRTEPLLLDVVVEDP